MKHLPNSLYVVFIILVLAAACGPATPTVTPVPTSPSVSKSVSVPNPAIEVSPPALLPTCTPPTPTMKDVNPYCSNSIKDLGGVTFGDYTNLTTDGTNSWLVADSIPAGVSCNLDNGTSTATCTGPAGTTFQAMICSSCAVPLAAASSDFVCATGFVLSADHKACESVDPKFYSHYMFCPSGSHWDTPKQKCVDNSTSKVVDPCPAGHPVYDPGTGRCFTTPQNVYTCKTFPVTLGVCKVLLPIPLAAVEFCQNNDANQGGVNIVVPKGAALTVDTQANHLDSCTLGGPRADGSRLLTCLGPSGQGFGGTACSNPSDPASCQEVTETLGECAGKPNPSSGPAPKPPCRPSILAPNCP